MRKVLPQLEAIYDLLSERGPGQSFMDLPFELRVTEKQGQKKKPHGPPAPGGIQKTIARYYDDVMADLPKHMQGKSKKQQKAYAAKVAWTRFCKHKDPTHPSCSEGVHESKDLSPAQFEALKRIALRWKKEVDDERKRWGAESAKSLSKSGVSIADLKIRKPTLQVLEKRGLIDIKRTTHRSSKLRYGDYGRRMSGSKTRIHVSMLARPTKKGIQMLKASLK